MFLSSSGSMSTSWKMKQSNRSSLEASRKPMFIIAALLKISGAPFNTEKNINMTKIAHLRKPSRQMGDLQCTGIQMDDTPKRQHTLCCYNIILRTHWAMKHLHSRLRILFIQLCTKLIAYSVPTIGCSGIYILSASK